MERDYQEKRIDRNRDISTHTLTWSVTRTQKTGMNTAPISTHTLTWSVTGEKYEISSTWEISTHTLTWSVTAKP